MQKIILIILAIIGFIGAPMFLYAAYNYDCTTLSLIMVVLSMILSAVSCQQLENKIKSK